MSKVRGFIAVPVEDQKIISSLVSIQKKLRETKASIKFVGKENFHVLLKFLGNIPAEKIPKLSSLVRESVKEQGPFDLKLKGLGCFPSLNYIRVIWAGVSQGRNQLTFLAGSINESLARMGIPGDRKYLPHLTLGRMKGGRGKAEVKEIVKKYGDKEFGGFIVNEIRLFKSELSRRGPVYTTLERYKL